jgi:hypothetical protein
MLLVVGPRAGRVGEAQRNRMCLGASRRSSSATAAAFGIFSPLGLSPFGAVPSRSVIGLTDQVW